MSDPVGLQQQENFNDDFSSIPDKTLKSNSPQHIREESCQNKRNMREPPVSQKLSYRHRTYFIQGSDSFLKRGDVT